MCSPTRRTTQGSRGARCSRSSTVTLTPTLTLTLIKAPAPSAPGGEGPLARKWAALRLLVEAGLDVLYVDVDGVLGSSPWAVSSG